MQTSSLPFRLRALPLAVLLLCLPAVAATAAQTPPALAGQTPAATNDAAPAEPELPKSLFRIPASPQEGRDPFFPQSALRKPEVIRSPVVAPPAIAELELKGISGTADHRLAIINNRTFEPGEEGTVVSNVGRVRLMCKEIGTNSVRVNINGQDRILTLPVR
jgi:hypothetical protein